MFSDLRSYTVGWQADVVQQLGGVVDLEARLEAEGRWTTHPLIRQTPQDSWLVTKRDNKKMVEGEVEGSKLIPRREIKRHQPAGTSRR